MPARDFAAFWGAGLATLLALAKLAHPRPVVLLDFVADKMGTSDVRLRITNPASFPVMLVDVVVPKFVSGEAAMQSGSIDGWRTVDVVKHVMAGKLNLLVPAGGKMAIHWTFKDDPKGALLFILHWRSHRSFAWPMVPTLIYRSKRATQALSQHPVTETDL